MSPVWRSTWRYKFCRNCTSSPSRWTPNALTRLRHAIAATAECNRYGHELAHDSESPVTAGHETDGGSGDHGRRSRCGPQFWSADGPLCSLGLPETGLSRYLPPQRTHDPALRRPRQRRLHGSRIHPSERRAAGTRSSGSTPSVRPFRLTRPAPRSTMGIRAPAA